MLIWLYLLFTLCSKVVAPKLWETRRLNGRIATSPRRLEYVPVSKHVVFRASIVSKHVVAELGKHSISTSFEWCEKETF